MEERTQIKFESPDIDGTTRPQLITLDQETPIEGTGERDNGESFTYHKWLCSNDQYFMASDSLDAMLKAIPNKVGKPTKIEKVVNPKGGYPFFIVNGLSKDDLVKQGQNSPPPVTDGALARVEQKLDQVIKLLTSEKATLQEAELPF